MRHLKTSIKLGLTLLLIFAGQLVVNAQSETVSARSALMEVLVAPLKQINDTDSSVKSRIDAAVNKVVDFDHISAAILKGVPDESSKLSKSDREKFDDLLKGLVRRSISGNSAKYSLLPKDLNDVPRETDGTLILSTFSVSDKDVEVQFRMIGYGNVWKVADMVTNGVSLTSVYRSQFVKIIKAEGFPVLFQKMQERLSQPI